MEFEKIQKIWGEQQNQQNAFAFDEQALFNSIKQKSKSAEKRIDTVEKGLIIVNTFVAVATMLDYLKENNNGYWDLILSLAIFFSVGYIIFFRLNRKKKTFEFDRSMIGELEHAISNTYSILKVSWLMIFGYTIPLILFIVSKMIYFNAPVEKWIIISFAFCFGLALIIIERKKAHLPRIKRLRILKDKLMELS